MRFHLLGILKINCGMIPKKTALPDRVETTLPLQSVRKNGGPLLEEALCVHD